MTDSSSEAPVDKTPIHEAFDRVLAHLDIKSKLLTIGEKATGGCFVVATSAGHVMAFMEVHESDPDKIQWLRDLGKKEVARLGANPSHLISREGRTEAYVSAVRIEHEILGFAGPSSNLAELCLFVAAVDLGSLGKRDVREVFEAHPNYFATPDVIRDFFE